MFLDILFDPVFFHSVHASFLCLQWTANWVMTLNLETGELTVREWDDGLRHSLFPPALSPPAQISLKEERRGEKKKKKNNKMTEMAGSRKTWFSLKSLSKQNLKQKNGNYLEEGQCFFSAIQIGNWERWSLNFLLEMHLLWGIRENCKGQIGDVIDYLWLWLFSREKERMLLITGLWKNLIKERKEW